MGAGHTSAMTVTEQNSQRPNLPCGNSNRNPDTWPLPPPAPELSKGQVFLVHTTPAPAQNHLPKSPRGTPAPALRALLPPPGLQPLTLTLRPPHRQTLFQSPGPDVLQPTILTFSFSPKPEPSRSTWDCPTLSPNFTSQLQSLGQPWECTKWNISESKKWKSAHDPPSLYLPCWHVEVWI